MLSDPYLSLFQPYFFWFVFVPTIFFFIFTRMEFCGLVSRSSLFCLSYCDFHCHQFVLPIWYFYSIHVSSRWGILKNSCFVQIWSPFIGVFIGVFIANSSNLRRTFDCVLNFLHIDSKWASLLQTKKCHFVTKVSVLQTRAVAWQFLTPAQSKVAIISTFSSLNWSSPLC